MGDRHGCRHARRRAGFGGGSRYDEINPILAPLKANTRWRVGEHEPPLADGSQDGRHPLSRAFEAVLEVAGEGDVSEVRITLRGRARTGMKLSHSAPNSQPDSCGTIRSHRSG